MPTISTIESFEIKNSEFSLNIGKSNFKRLHGHDYYELFLILSGSVEHYHNDKKYVLDKNTLVFIRPGEQHCFRKHHKSNHTRLNLSFTMPELKKLTDALFPEFYDFLTTPGDLLFFKVSDGDADAIYSAALRLISLAGKPDSALFKGLYRSLVSKALCMTYERRDFSQENYPEWLGNFISLMKTPECICLKVGELSKKSNYSYSHLCKLFRKYTGETLLEYFKDLKLSYARQLLEVTDYPCREICELVGYQSSGHFIKEFTRKFQKTPSEWRAAHSPHITDL